MTMYNRIVYILTGMVLALTITIASCSTITPSVITSPTQNITNTSQDLATSVTSLTKTTAAIASDASGIQSTNPSSVVLSKVSDINIQTGIQTGIVSSLTQDQSQLDEAIQQSNTLTSELATTTAALTKAQASTAAANAAKYTWCSICFIVVFVICIAAIFSGLVTPQISKLCVALGGGSLIGTLVCIALVQTYTLIPWIIGGIAVIGAGIVIWRFYVAKKAITTTTTLAADAVANVATLTRQLDTLENTSNALIEENKKYNTAATEVVYTTEAAKPLMTLNGRKAIFGDGPIPGIAYTLQSKTTRLFVESVRREMTNIAPSIPEAICSDFTEPIVATDLVSDNEYGTQRNTFSIRSRRGRRGYIYTGEPSVVIVR